MHTTIIFNHFFADTLLTYHTNDIQVGLEQARNRTKELLKYMNDYEFTTITAIDELAESVLTLIGIDKALELVDEIYNYYGV